MIFFSQMFAIIWSVIFVHIYNQESKNCQRFKFFSMVLIDLENFYFYTFLVNDPTSTSPF